MPARWFDLDKERGAFFKVLATTERTQVGVMTIGPGEEAGAPETHEGSDQVFHFVSGRAEVKVWDEGPEADPVRRVVGPGAALLVPAGTQHWVKSVGEEPLFFFTVYGPPEY